MELVLEVYMLTKSFPDEERYGLTSQVRRSAISIPSNIAEGAARSGSLEFIRFLHIALGSCSELDTQMELGSRLGYLSDKAWQTFDNKLNDVDRMLIGLRNSLIAKKKRVKEGTHGQ